MEQNTPQEEIRRIIISDMVKKRNSIVPVIGEDTIVYSLGVPLILLRLSDGLLKWIRKAFVEGSKVMWIHSLLTNISSFAHEAGFLAPRIHVLK